MHINFAGSYRGSQNVVRGTWSSEFLTGVVTNTIHGLGWRDHQSPRCDKKSWDKRIGQEGLGCQHYRDIVVSRVGTKRNRIGMFNKRELTIFRQVVYKGI